METRIIETYINYGTGNGLWAWKHTLIEIDGEFLWVKEKVEIETDN